MLITKNSFSRNIFFTLFAFTGFLYLYPYFSWHQPFYYRIFFILTISTYIYLLFREKIYIEKKVILPFFIMTIFLIFYWSPREMGNLGLSFYSVLLLLFFILNNEEKQKVFYIFSWIVAISYIPSLIIEFFMILGIEMPWERLEPLNYVKNWYGVYYREYFGAVVLSDQIHSVGGVEYFRLSGMFDEAGVVGTVNALLLAADKYKLKNSLKNKILLLSGVASLSFAFFIITLAYLALYKKSKFLLVVFSLLVIFYNTSNESVFHKHFFNRLTFHDGHLAGDNRTDQNYEIAFNYFLEKSDTLSLLFGKGHLAVANNPYMVESSTWKHLVYDQGIIGFIWIIFLIILYTYIYHKNKWAFYFTIVFILSIYQRPYIVDLSFFIIFFGGLSNLSIKNIGNSTFCNESSEMRCKNKKIINQLR